MNEDQFAKNIARTLNEGLPRISDANLAKLRAGRQKAMEKYRAPIRILGMVTVSGQVLDVSGWARKPLFWVPAIAIAASIAFATLNGADDGYDDVGELDAKLLTGELPIDAFLDQDFGSWVKESAN